MYTLFYARMHTLYTNMVLKEGSQPVELPFTLTESAANTFTRHANGLTLPIVQENNEAFDVDLVQVTGTGQMDASAAGEIANDFQIHLNANASDVLGWESFDLLCAEVTRGHASAADTVGYAFKESLHMDTRGRANYVVVDRIYPCIKGVLQSTAIGISGRVIGSIVKLSQSQISQLILQQTRQS